ncbi:MAG: choice-of-anchor M domain-containing protein [Verrucomicrobiales bacterium]|nr:choice-of-anchor M domain-containing protein [Verrucomicrobiales bacterium]
MKPQVTKLNLKPDPHMKHSPIVLIRRGVIGDAARRRPVAPPTAQFRKSLLARALLALACVLIFAPSSFAATQISYQFTRLMLTNSAGDAANKINNRGEITGTVDGPDGVSRGYVYADGKERERGGWTGSKFTEWEGVNASGELAGYYADPADATGGTYKAFIRKPDGTFLPIGWPGDTNFNFTVEINDAGQVAGGSSAQGWVRNPDDTYVVFKTPGYQTSGAFGINNAGIAVGVAFNGFFDKANGLIYDTKADTFQIWNSPGAATTTLYGINNRGDIVGGFKQTVASAEVPFIRWADGSTQVLNFAEEPNVRVYGINDARVIVGRYLDTNKVSHSFLAAPVVPVKHYAVTRIDVPGAVHTTPNAINDAGVIAGEWYNADYTVNKGFTRAPDGTFTIIDPATGYGGISVSGINNAGDIAGFMESNGFVRRGTIFTILQPPGAGATYGRDINDAGVVVGDATGALGNFNWRHDGTNFTLLNIPGAAQSGFTAINNAGDVLGYTIRTIVGNGVTNQVNSNWLLRGTNFTVITYPNATLSSLLSISENGTILGLFRQAATGTRNRYFLYEQGQFAEIEFDGDLSWGRYAATDLNESGSLVGNFRTADNGYHGFVATPQPLLYTFQSFDAPGAAGTYAFGIDNAGRIVGRFVHGDSGHGYLRETNGVFTTIDVPGMTFTEAFGINSSGQIVGWTTNLTSAQGFLRSADGTLATFAATNATRTFALGINDSGMITGAFKDASGNQHGFVRDAAGLFTTFDPPGSTFTEAYGINNVSTVVGYFVDATGERGFVRQSDGQITIYDVPGSEGSGILGMNNTGLWTGLLEDERGIHGFVRDAHGRLDILDYPGTAFTVALGVSDSGVVVGYYADAAGALHGFIASPAVGLDKGHTDIGIAFEDGEWDLHIHSESTDTEYELGKAVLQFGAASEQPISDALDFQFLGDPGRSTWILPQVENENLLFLGLAAEEIGDGVFVNNTLRVELVSVEGPGHFFVWTLDPLGKPQLHFNSADGILSSQDFYTLQTGGHQDMNWAFSAPGTYRVGYRVSGTLVAGNQFTQSDVAYYTFEVPEPKLPQPPEPDNTAYLITDLGTLGGETSRAFRINEQGHIVGEAARADGSSGAFLWTNGVMVDLGALNGTNSLALGLNEQGQVVGRAQNADGRMKAFVWDEARGMIEVPDLGGTGTFDSSLYAINEGGFAVGQARNAANQLQAFYRSNNVSTAVPLPGGSNSRAWDVNAAGQLSGWGRDTNNAIVGFRWSVASGYEFVGTLVPGADVFAVGINTNGHIAGAIQKDFGHQPASATPPISRGFVWDGASLHDLGQPEGYDGAAGNYINDHGWVAGVAYRFNDAGQPAEDSAFLHKDGVNYELDRIIPHRAGWHLQWAYDVNNQGAIVGWGLKEGSEQRRAFLAESATRLTKGHTDLGALLEDGALELEVHSEELGEEFAPGAALLQLPALTQTTVPTNTAFAFLGVAGAPVWVLPQVQHPRLLFLGLAAEEIEKGVLVNDEIRFTLKNVEGPGHFFLYGVDGFRNPVVNWNSRDGFTASDAKTIVAGGHEDMNWAFTAPGYYRVTIEANGTLVAGNKALSSGDVTYHFEVIIIEPRLSLTHNDAATLALTVTTEDAIVYQLQSAASVNGPWSNVGQPFIGTGRHKQFTVPIAGNAAGFYRIFTEVGN